MAFTVSSLVQNIYQELGQVDPVFGLFEATGGSATTFVNSSFANYENAPETDAFKNQLAIVVRDAGGAGASPEGKWGLCSAYVDSTYTGTIATVTDAIASGDQIMLAKQDKYPLQTVLFAINKGLESLGDLPQNSNTSLTTVANQTEYNIPVAVKRGLKQVWIQGYTGATSNNQWIEIHDKRNELTTGGAASILYISQPTSGRTIRLIYDGVHTVVNAYSDVINEYVHPTVATKASILKLLEWYNRRDENQDPQSYTLYLEGEYRDKYLPKALMENPIKKLRRSPNYNIIDASNNIDKLPTPTP